MDGILGGFPALAPPPGVVSNFDNPYTGAPPVGIAMGVIAGLATAAFVARIFTKAYVMKQLQAEDYLLVLGWCFFIVYITFTVVAFPTISGRHQWNVKLSQMIPFLQDLNYAELFYGFCMLFTKLAILQQIKRIFVPNSGSQRRSSIHWLTLCLMALGVLYYSAAIIVEIAQCVPREKIWNPLLPGTCVDNNANVISAGAFNLGYDILIFALPIYAILRLKMALKRKLGICAVFATGLLAVLSSLLRLYYSIVILSAQDVTFEILNLAWTACLEGAAAILVACFPVMPRLYQYIRSERRRWHTFLYKSRSRSRSTAQQRVNQQRPASEREKSRWKWKFGTSITNSTGIGTETSGLTKLTTTTINSGKEQECDGPRTREAGVQALPRAPLPAAVVSYGRPVRAPAADIYDNAQLGQYTAETRTGKQPLRQHPALVDVERARPDHQSPHIDAEAQRRERQRQLEREREMERERQREAERQEQKRRERQRQRETERQRQWLQQQAVLQSGVKHEPQRQRIDGPQRERERQRQWQRQQAVSEQWEVKQEMKEQPQQQGRPRRPSHVAELIKPEEVAELRRSPRSEQGEGYGSWRKERNAWAEIGSNKEGKEVGEYAGGREALTSSGSGRW